MSDHPPDRRRTRENVTRDRLITAAVGVFAQRGYNDVSTRDLASAAGVLQSGIGYHFGSKLELYLAVADRVIESFAPPLQECARRHPADHTARLGTLLSYFDDVVSVMLQPGGEAVAVSRFCLRELAVDGPAREQIDERIIKPTIGHAAELLRALESVHADAHEVTDRATALFGPITLYRLLNNNRLANMSQEDARAAQKMVRDAIHGAIHALV